MNTFYRNKPAFNPLFTVQNAIKFLFVVALMLVQKTSSYAQNFITEWNFPTAETILRFNALTAGGAVNYSYTCSPSGNFGNGSFTQTIQGLVTLTGLNIEAGDVVTLSMEPQNLRRFYNLSNPDATKLTDVVAWGNVPWTSMLHAFNGCSNLNISATDVPNLSNVISINGMFSFCTSLTGPNNINSWNTANISDMGGVFSYASAFNQPLNSWNTASVTNMGLMFNNASSFNQPLNSWNTSNVSNMFYMFNNAVSFNQPLNSWNTSNASDMSGMFAGANSFNQPLTSWNTSNVLNTQLMFNNAASFNQPLNSWNTSSLTNMQSMFALATQFNQPLDNCNTSNVNNMANVFLGASSFNQSLGNWTINSNVNLSNMLINCGMDCNNYSATLKGWHDNNPAVTGLSLGATGLEYGTHVLNERNTLTTTRSWSITGDASSGSVCMNGAFITEWNFPASATEIKFNAHTQGGAVNYYWTCTPSGNSGWGSFNKPSPETLHYRD